MRIKLLMGATQGSGATLIAPPGEIPIRIVAVSSLLPLTMPLKSTNLGCKEVIVTASGTSALEMAAILYEVGPGDEVILPSYTFSSTANAFVLRGAIPVFVDIRRDTLNIDESLVEAAITKATKVICVVHYGGMPCEMDTICDIATRHSLFVVEDAAQGFLSTYKGRQLGTLGDFGCISFHYTKNIICGEGGALVVNRSEEHAKRALVLWEKGTNRCDFMSGQVDKYEWVDVGSSNVPSEISCAILWAQLQESESITARRKLNYRAYMDGIRAVAKRNVSIPVQLPGSATLTRTSSTSCCHPGKRATRCRGVSRKETFLPSPIMCLCTVALLANVMAALAPVQRL